MTIMGEKTILSHGKMNGEFQTIHRSLNHIIKPGPLVYKEEKT